MLTLFSASQGLKEKFDYNKVLKALKKGRHFESDPISRDLAADDLDVPPFMAVAPQ